MKSSAAMEMSADLFDFNQVEIFNALEQLSALDIEHKIAIPQFIVVGDQSSGKSSLLESLIRFPFPVSGTRCTRFPIKLILRRDEKTRARAGIQPYVNNDGSHGEAAQIVHFVDTVDCNAPEALRSIITEASKRMNVYHEQSTNGYTEEGSLKQFSEDMLVIELYGPKLPILSLIDLPGLFQQDTAQCNREIVERMVKSHMHSESNVIILLLSAMSGHENQSAKRVFVEVLEEDRRLRDRTVGVYTHVDCIKTDGVADERLEEVKMILKGEQEELKVEHHWHVVKNQSWKERKASISLHDRDNNEMNFFCGKDWEEIPDKQKGIQSLREALKKALHARISEELPRSLNKIKDSIRNLKAEGKITESWRAEGFSRRTHLNDIAEQFQGLLREASRGTYRDEHCPKLHQNGARCKDCFFAPSRGGSSNFEISAQQKQQAKKLCSNVRGLNMAFTKGMQRCGKANILVKDLTPTQDPCSSREGVFADTSQCFLSKKLLSNYYTHDDPKPISQDSFQLAVAKAIDSNRGHEPQGEVNPNVYEDVFGEQSAPWMDIAKNHLEAVWELTENFIALALEHACKDKLIFKRLNENIVYENIEDLRKHSYDTLKSLFDCRSVGITSLFDSFGDVSNRQQAMEQAEAFISMSISPGKLQPETVKYVRTMLQDLTPSLLSAFRFLGGSQIAMHSIMAKIADILLKDASSDTDNTESGSEGGWPNKSDCDTKEPSRLDAARVITVVEAHYQSAMMSFVAYVNSLVIEIGILNKLCTNILTRHHIDKLHQDTINEITTEDPDAINKRQKNLRNLAALETIMKILENNRSN